MKDRSLIRAGLAIGISISIGVGLTYALLNPDMGEARSLLFYLLAGSLGSVLLVEVALRRVYSSGRIALKPALIAAFALVILVGLANTFFLSFFMFVNVSHDLPMLVAILAFAGAVGIYMADRLADALARSLSRLAVAARSITSGDMSARVEVSGTGELKDVAVAFNEMAQNLDDAVTRQVELEEERKQLVAAISHDLRTPLSSARAMLEAVIDGVVDDPAEQTDYLGRINREVGILTSLVDDLFQLSMLDAGALRLDLEPTPVQQLVLDAARGMEPTARLKGLSIETNVSGGGPVLADGVRIQRVLMNLLQNAIRHTPADGSVTVSAHEQTDGIVVEVTDTGSGIDPSDLPKIWNPFFRPEASRSRTGDGSARSGLGLAITRAIVEIHGGEITASSTPGHGSKFRFPLPRQSNSPSSIPA
ncbi:MAG: HAMP domain-containing protein [Chloroflexi bacterium]|nr:HAMP domain-containing protein [Chloroflexota bacterium]